MMMSTHSSHGARYYYHANVGRALSSFLRPLHRVSKEAYFSRGRVWLFLLVLSLPASLKEILFVWRLPEHSYYRGWGMEGGTGARVVPSFYSRGLVH